MGGKESCKVYYDLLCTLLPHTCSKYSNYLTFTKNYTKNNHNVLIIIVPSHVEACASVPSCNPLDLDHIKSCLMTPYWPFYSFHLHIGRGEPASQATIPALSNIWVKILIFAPCELETGDWGPPLMVQMCCQFLLGTAHRPQTCSCPNPNQITIKVTRG